MEWGLILAGLGAFIAAVVAGVGSAVWVGKAGQAVAGVVAEEPESSVHCSYCSFYPVRKAFTV